MGHNAFVGCHTVPGWDYGERDIQTDYGPVNTCRELGRDHHLSGPDLSVYILLGTTTDQLAALRIDYFDLNSNMRDGWSADAYEVDADSVSSWLSADETRQLAADILARGGTEKLVWHIHTGE
jgi:hypothetical protein